MKRLLFSTLVLLIAVTGCEQKKEAPALKTETKVKKAAAVELKLPAPKKIFEEPMPAQTFELPSEALQVWRHAQSAKPALVLFSIHPLLDPLNEKQKEEITNLITTGDAESFRQRGSYYRVNPALVPTQTVSAAIDNQFFSELVWVIPTRFGIEELSVDILRQQMVEANFLTKEEGQKLTYTEGVTTGTVRGLPFRAVHPDAMPDLEKPVVLHIDTGYFKGMFKNEVATPLYDILHQTIMRIIQNEWQVYSTTLSYSTEELMFSIDVRFLVTALAKMIEDPTLLQQMPQGWKLHAEAMYLGNMYMESKSRDIIEAAAVAAPDDPVIVYALSQVRFQQGRPDEAFTLLDKAVQLDPGYASAYMQLADTGMEKQQYDKALELQKKAISLYPENPFLRISQANMLIENNRADQAADIIRELLNLEWSKGFHPNAAADLNELLKFAKDPEGYMPPAASEENK